MRKDRRNARDEAKRLDREEVALDFLPAVKA
jgi:hypothetical protein